MSGNCLVCCIKRGALVYVRNCKTEIKTEIGKQNQLGTLTNRKTPNRNEARSGRNYPHYFAHIISKENVFAFIFVVFQK